MDDEFFASHDRSSIQSRTDAMQSVNKMDLPKTVVISDDSFSGLGFKTSLAAAVDLERLQGSYGEKLPYLIGLSLREVWFSLFLASSYVALMVADGSMCDNEYTNELATAEGYGEIEGIAWTLYDSLCRDMESNQQATFREGTPFGERLPMADILRGAAMYWFAAAATSHHAGDAEGAFNWLNEAQTALSFAMADFMWDAGAESERESAMETSISEVKAARTTLAKAAAHAKHSGNRADKAKVFAWCDQNMKRFSSMDDAASDIAETFIPQKFRAVRVWMTEWKKLRSAGTPQPLLADCPPCRQALQ